MNKTKMKKIKINGRLTIVVDEKTNKGDVTEMLNYGNILRKWEGLKPMTMKDILATREFWEYTMLMNIEDPITNIDCIDDNIDCLDYREMIKMFPSMIESENYMSLYLILKVGAILDDWLELQIIDAMLNKMNNMNSMNIDDILGFPKFWEFVVERSEEEDINILRDNTKDNGKLDYRKLIEIFPTVIEPYGGYLFNSSNLLPSLDDFRRLELDCNLENNEFFDQLKEDIEISLSPTGEYWLEDIEFLIEFSMSLKYECDESETRCYIENLISFIQGGIIESYEELVAVLIGTARKALVCLRD